MSAKLGQRKKIVLIRAAAQRGLRPLLHQTLLCAADTAVRQRHLVFRIDADKVQTMPFDVPVELSFREATTMDDLPAAARTRLTDPEEHIDWGHEDWFGRGWRLWVAERADQLVALGWWRSAEQSQDFFVAMPKGTELLWHSTVLPEFQGQGLQVSLRLSLMRQRVAQGVTAFFTNCRDYNIPSRRNIGRMGFDCIGVCTVNKITGRRHYRALPPGTAL